MIETHSPPRGAIHSLVLIPGWRACRQLACAVVLTLVGACAGLPQIDRSGSFVVTAIPISGDTTLGRIAQTSQPSLELSGFRLMPLGAFALDARLQLARRAERSLDVQYYDFENDA
ncbi:MAG: hypothetical protein ABSF50_16855, partial [Burkholderiaceae bacterium]